MGFNSGFKGLIPFCSPKYEDGEWKSRTNRELEELNKGENIVKWIKVQRIKLAGSPRENGGR